jgi:DNA-binding transcriptional MerR regulator
MASHHPIRKTVKATGPALAAEIPDKLYFRIGEVARLCKVPAYVLRFWESEFPQLKPNKGGTGQRLYRRRDVEMAMRVKTLLKDEGYTIPGARSVLKSEFRQKGPQLSLLGEAIPKSEVKQLRTLRRELEAIVTMLSQPIADAQKSSTKLQPQPANGDSPAAPRRSSSRTLSGTDAGGRPSERTPAADLLFESLATGSNSEGDGN